MKKTIFLICTIFIFSCEKQDDGFLNTCIEGEVIAHEKCLVGTLIKVNDIAIGDTITIPDYNSLGHISGFTKYTNVIKTPGSFGFGKLFFQIREYNSTEDYSIFDPGHPCTSDIKPYNVPQYVVTKFSRESCP